MMHQVSIINVSHVIAQRSPEKEEGGSKTFALLSPFSFFYFGEGVLQIKKFTLMRLLLHLGSLTP